MAANASGGYGPPRMGEAHVKFGRQTMPYLLIIMFAATNPVRLGHVESIRFDDQKACMSAMSAILSSSPMGSTRSGDNAPVGILQMKCVPAASK